MWHLTRHESVHLSQKQEISQRDLLGCPHGLQNAARIPTHTFPGIGCCAQTMHTIYFLAHIMKYRILVTPPRPRPNQNLMVYCRTQHHHRHQTRQEVPLVESSLENLLENTPHAWIFCFRFQASYFADCSRFQYFYVYWIHFFFFFVWHTRPRWFNEWINFPLGFPLKQGKHAIVHICTSLQRISFLRGFPLKIEARFWKKIKKII